ncbi:DNA-directed RNA polymerase subunit omega [Kocuria palustris]|uniref:DNA-directed RNA polymerase subunit omega n=1 Tax=Kocuria palustris TaxID=71999 RepID=UPI00119F73DF|nr:DNA-directed RNA polymerase subunit omega [Kocuria palustris]
MSTHHQGIIEPPVDRLLTKADSKYGLVIFSARRARQINAYYSQLHEGLFEYVGPLVDVQPNEKSLSVAMREIDENLIESTEVDHAGFSENGQLNTERELGVEDFYSDYFGEQQGGELDSSMVFSEGAEDRGADQLTPEAEASEEQAEVPSDEPSEN